MNAALGHNTRTPLPRKRRPVLRLHRPEPEASPLSLLHQTPPEPEGSTFWLIEQLKNARRLPPAERLGTCIAANFAYLANTQVKKLPVVLRELAEGKFRPLATEVRLEWYLLYPQSQFLDEQTTDPFRWLCRSREYLQAVACLDPRAHRWTLTGEDRGPVSSGDALGAARRLADEEESSRRTRAKSRAFQEALKADKSATAGGSGDRD